MATPGKHTPTYICWGHISQRCINPKMKDFHKYGGRGITVCERWQKFENFLADMGERPGPEYSIDRIDNNGNYEPGNCRWATKMEQAKNTRQNRWLEYGGVRLHFADWARRLHINQSSLHRRIKAWGVERALAAPRGKTGLKSQSY